MNIRKEFMAKRLLSWLMMCILLVCSISFQVSASEEEKEITVSGTVDKNHTGKETEESENLSSNMPSNIENTGNQTEETGSADEGKTGNKGQDVRNDTGQNAEQNSKNYIQKITETSGDGKSMMGNQNDLEVSGGNEGNTEQSVQISKRKLRKLLQLGNPDAGISPVNTVQPEELNPDVNTVMSAVRAYMLAHDTAMDYTSSWNVIGLARSGLDVPQSYYDQYYSNVIAMCRMKNWEITRTKYSEYSKLIIALTSIGVDAQNVLGQNLFSYLSDMTNIKKQGNNGPIWALIALNSHPSYSIPINGSAEEQTTEEGLIQEILSVKCEGGGWTLAGEADCDMTGMAIQALAPYYNQRDDVTDAVNQGLEWLSKKQGQETGAFSTKSNGKDIETAESTVQVIVALSALGFDCKEDLTQELGFDFIIDNGQWPMTALYKYYLSEGGFMHVLPGAENNGGGEAGTLNGMATEQGMYATAAYDRLCRGKEDPEVTALYDMSDVNIQPGGEPKVPSTIAVDNQTQTNTGTTSGGNINVLRISLNYSKINLTAGKSKKLKATITPSNASNKKVKWTSSNKKVAKVNDKGKVTGIKAGTAKITVKATDGSGKKATCKVEVTSAGSSATKKVANKQASGSTAAKTASGKTASLGTTAAKNGTTATGKSSSEKGWSFTGDEYVPETDSSGDVFESDTANTGNDLEEKNLWKKEKFPYVAAGVGGLASLEGLIILLRRRKNILTFIKGILHKMRRNG